MDMLKRKNLGSYDVSYDMYNSSIHGRCALG